MNTNRPPTSATAVPGRPQATPVLVLDPVPDPEPPRAPRIVEPHPQPLSTGS